MTIDNLYRFIQLIANKEQRGFIKPSEFNLLAEQAQLDLIHDRVARYKTEAEKAKGASMTLVQNHSVLDDIRTVIMEKNLNYISANFAHAYPPDIFDQEEQAVMGEYLHFLRLYFKTADMVDGIKIDLITQDQLDNRFKSQVTPVESDKMIAVMHDKGFRIYTYNNDNNEIQQITTGQGTNDIYLTYIGKPVAPHWGYYLLNDQYVYNPISTNTTQLTLPSKTHREIIQRMLSYIGISLRDQEPMAYAEAKVKDQSISTK
tara:strand:- start:971 stop:1750 length:780 start_codon:yes stop_codon:yes gene_type:complete